jgi:hypothetical protein
MFWDEKKNLKYKKLLVIQFNNDIIPELTMILCYLLILIFKFILVLIKKDIPIQWVIQDPLGYFSWRKKYTLILPNWYVDI